MGVLTPDVLGESRAADFHQPGTCLGSRTKSCSSPLGGSAALRKGKDSPYAAGWRCHLTPDLARWRTHSDGLSKKLSEEQQTRFFSKVNLAEELEVADVGH